MKILKVMKLFSIFMFAFMCCASANTYSQKQIVSLNLHRANVNALFKEIRRQTELRFVYNEEHVAKLARFDIKEDKITVEEVLDRVFKNTSLQYFFEDNVIYIVPRVRDDEVKKDSIRTVQGTVRDVNGIALPGVTVIIKGTTLGVATNKNGFFKLAIPRDTATLVFTFVGMETQYVKIEKLKAGEVQKDLKIVMKEDEVLLEDVVVTGYAYIKKSNFTGSATQVKREDILKVATGNIIDALQVFDPSLRIMKNNLMGADPNTLPEFYVRGRSGINSVKELDALQAEDVSQFALTNNPNTPIFILDGFEVSVEKIYDFDLNRIKDITILKDAAATAIYGSRASNGVIVIETLAPKPGQLMVSYSGNFAITAPDLSSYHMMNSREKLEAEVASDLFVPYQYLASDQFTPISYDQELQSLTWEYLQKKNNILIGVDNYWLSKPLSTMFNHKHSIYVEGGTEDIRFGIELRYDDQNGVMKKSYRNRMGVGMTLDYRYRGLQVRNQISYDAVNAKNSPYGSFSEYTRKQPYALWRDPETGEYLKTINSIANTENNPLYEAQLGNISKDGYKEIMDNLLLIWYAGDYLLIKGQFAFSYKDADTKRFIDPRSNTFSQENDLFAKGELTLSETTTTNWNVNVFAAYNRTLGKHNVNFSIGINAVSTNYKYMYSQYRGFPDAERHSPAYAYEIKTKPSFTDNKTRLFGSFLMLNYSFNNIYLFDLSARFDGSSEFGSDRKWSSFWSVGVGLNLHNYDFVKKANVIDLLKITGNVGETGKTEFSPYVARNTFKMQLDDWYPTGIGANLIYMGNENLTWERQRTWNLRGELAMFKNLFTLKADYYYKKTMDLITEVSLPSSSGFSKYTDNIGQILNKGFELDLNVRAYTSKDLDIMVFGNLAHNKNEILKISESLKQYNERIDEYYGGYYNTSSTNLNDILFYAKQNAEYSKPFMKYEEGSSLTAIYGMKSLGINPANGREVYVKRDGTITYDWSSAEQQKIGDTEPWAQGSFGLNVRYKGFTLYTTFLYEWGGDAYNQTLVDNVENVNLRLYNADERVLTERWQIPGDQTPLKAIQDRYRVTQPTSRFVQKNSFVTFNSLSLGYDFDSEFVRKIRMSTLRLQFNMKDIATKSTIKREMGLNYPFARTFTLTLNASF